MGEVKKQFTLLYPPIQVSLVRACEDMHRIHRMPLRVTETLRSMERQAALYAQGRTAPGKIVTYSRPGYSWHHYGLAADFCFAGNDPYLEKHKDGAFLWNEFGKFMGYHGLTWGGSFRVFKDRPHVQKTFGLTLQECMELFEHGGNGAVWAAIDKIIEDHTP